VYWSEQIMLWMVSRYDDVSLIGPDSRFAELASRTPPLRYPVLKSYFYRTRPSRNRCEARWDAGASRTEWHRSALTRMARGSWQLRRR
jgi:hypothetical protein